jgi:hypothetical protein
MEAAPSQLVSKEFDATNQFLFVDKKDGKVYMTDKGYLGRSSILRKIVSLFGSKNYDLVAVTKALLQQNPELAKTDTLPKLHKRISSQICGEKANPQKASKLFERIFLQLPSLGSIFRDKCGELALLPIFKQEAVDIAVAVILGENVSKDRPRNLKTEAGTYSLWYQEKEKWLHISFKPKDGVAQDLAIQLYKDSSIIRVAAKAELVTPVFIQALLTNIRLGLNSPLPPNPEAE